MEILEKLENPDFKATKSDKILIEYIKNNLLDVAYKSISKIAKDNNIGEYTINRFARKIGFHSLKDFKVTLFKVTLVKEVSSNSNKNIINNSIENDEPAIETAKNY